MTRAIRPARLPRFLALAAALCGVLFAASLVIAPPASAQDVTIWSADLEAQTLNTAQDEFGCSESGPFNGQCANSNVLSDDDFKLHGTTYTIRRIEDDGSRLRLTLNSLLPENVLKILTLHVGDTELDFEDASVSSSNKRYTWSSSSPSWSSGDDVDLKITDASGPSLVKNTSLDGNDRNLSEDGHRSAQAFTAGTWARVTSIGIGIGDEVDDDVEVTLHEERNDGRRLSRRQTENSGEPFEHHGKFGQRVHRSRRRHRAGGIENVLRAGQDDLERHGSRFRDRYRFRWQRRRRRGREELDHRQWFVDKQAFERFMAG